MTRPAPHSPLTDKQTAVLELVVDGLTSREIAAQLGCSPATAKAHCDVLRRKFGVERKSHLIATGRVYLGESR